MRVTGVGAFFTAHVIGRKQQLHPTLVKGRGFNKVCSLGEIIHIIIYFFNVFMRAAPFKGGLLLRAMTRFDGVVITLMQGELNIIITFK